MPERSPGSVSGAGAWWRMFAPNCPEALAIRYAANLVGAEAVYLCHPPDAGGARDARRDRSRLVVLFPRDRESAAGASHAPAAIGRGSRCRRCGSTSWPQPRRRPDAEPGAAGRSGGDRLVRRHHRGPEGELARLRRLHGAVAAPSPPTGGSWSTAHLAYLSQVLVDITLLGGGRWCCATVRAADTLATIEAERITDLFLVEPQLFELMDHPEVARRDLSSLRALTHIGASARRCCAAAPGNGSARCIAHTYGASEMGIVSVLPPAEHDLAHPERFTCAGRIYPGVEVRFRRADGRLAARASRRDRGALPGDGAGYRNRPVEQAQAFVDGWYHTGDLGRLDPDG